MNIIKKFSNTLELSFSLAKANFKVRNEGSYLGIFWYLLDPLAMFLILLFLAGTITNTSIPYYPAYLLLGLIMFNFFRQSTGAATGTISGNAGFIKSIKIPYEAFVISSIFQSIFSHLFEIIVFGLLMIYLGIPLTGLIFYPFIFLLLAIFAAGFSFILSTIGTYIFDLGNVWGIIMNLLWFSTPIFYIIKPENMTLVNRFNPLRYFISIARELVIYNQMPNIQTILVTLAASICTFILGLIIFRRYKHKFAEMI